MADLSPRTAVGAATVSGTPAGVTWLEAAEAGESPTALVALTVKLYAVPLLRPVMVAVVVSAPATVLVTPPGVLVIV